MQKLKFPLACFFILFFFSTAYAAQTSFLTSIYSLLLGGGPPANANTLIVEKKGTGTGTITSNISGIDCGSDCWEVYDDNAIVTLTAYSNSDSYFWGWSGGVCVGTAPCRIVMSQATTVEATFSSNNASEETLLVVVSGQGVVTSTDISCSEAGGAGCQKSYPTDSKVTLTHQANGGTTFTGWRINGESSNTCPVAATCEVTMSESMTVTALFTQPYPTETESNDSIELANNLTLGSEIGGVIEARGLSDYYKIEVNSARTVTAHLSSTFGSVSSDRRMLVQIQDSAGTVLTQLYVRPSTPDTTPVYFGTPFNFYLPEAGTYYVVLMGTGVDYTSPANPAFFDVEYKLTVDANNSANPGPAETEPNDELGTADSLAYNTVMHGSLLSVDDVDWFVLDDPSGLYGATMEFTTPEEGRNWIVTVYPSNGTSGDPLAIAAVKDGSKLYLPESNKYYFVVSDFRPWGQDANVYKGESYTLQVTKSDSASPAGEIEDNNASSNGFNLVLDPVTPKTFAGQSQLVTQASGVQIAQDEDIFHISGIQNNVYKFTFETDNDVTGVKWFVTSPLLTSSCSSLGVSESNCWAPSAGDNESEAITIPNGGFDFNVKTYAGGSNTSSATYRITGTKQP